jgi:hypothetical protein
MALNAVMNDGEKRCVHAAANRDDASVDHRARVHEGISTNDDDISANMTFDYGIAMENDDCAREG